MVNTNYFAIVVKIDCEHLFLSQGKQLIISFHLLEEKDPLYIIILAALFTNKRKAHIGSLTSFLSKKKTFLLLLLLISNSLFYALSHISARVWLL
jgi:hypothetical protein